MIADSTNQRSTQSLPLVRARGQRAWFAPPYDHEYTRAPAAAGMSAEYVAGLHVFFFFCLGSDACRRIGSADANRALVISGVLLLVLRRV